MNFEKQSSLMVLARTMMDSDFIFWVIYGRKVAFCEPDNIIFAKTMANE